MSDFTRLVRAQFDNFIKKEVNEGSAWQEKLDMEEGINNKARQSEVQHSWQWNDELEGWVERKSAQATIFKDNLTTRACVRLSCCAFDFLGIRNAAAAAAGTSSTRFTSRSRSETCSS